MKVRTPPNLRRQDEDHECCGTCDYYDGVCELYDDYPVWSTQVCDDWAWEDF